MGYSIYRYGTLYRNNMFMAIVGDVTTVQSEENQNQNWNYWPYSLLWFVLYVYIFNEKTRLVLYLDPFKVLRDIKNHMLWITKLSNKS